MIKSTNMQQAKSLKPKTKIGFIITKGVWGGAQKYVYNLATNVSKNKFEVFVITGEGGILKKKLEEVVNPAGNIKVYEIKSLKRDMSVFGEIYSFVKMYKIIKKESPEILHLNSSKASGIGAIVGRMLLVPTIIQTAHGWAFNESHRNLLSRFFIYIFSWITVFLCNKTIVIAKEEKNQALRMPFIRDNKIVLIRNGIDDKKYIDKKIVREAILDRVRYKNSFVPNEKTIWIGTISELHKNKGLGYIIKALTEIKNDFLFFIIGEGEERRYLEHLIEEKGLKDKVFLLGFIENANIYLKAFDIFTLTSIKEGLPYTVLEAGKAGLPVLASNTGGIPDIIDDSKNGLLCRKKDVQEIKKDLEFLMNNPDKRKEFGSKLKEKIEKDFTVEDMLRKTIALYK